MARCRSCGGAVTACLDFGRQPVSNAFLRPQDVDREVFFHLAVGLCGSCTMVQQLHELPREQMFGASYPYRSSGSVLLQEHFQRTAALLLTTALSGGAGRFVVEIGCNDGIMLKSFHDAGVRHLGVDPSAGATQVARDGGIRIESSFFDDESAAKIRNEHGQADLIFSANTISHVPYLDRILRGVDTLLAPGGTFVFEDRYLADILANTYFDQIYDEHFYLFAVRSVQHWVRSAGFDLVDVTHLDVHGGSMRYTVARAGTREVSGAVSTALAREATLGLASPATYARFAAAIEHNRRSLIDLLRQLRASGKRVVGYGATSKSATVTNYCGIDAQLVEFICDSTPEKQGRLSPGAHIPIRPSSAFADPYPDYALLFAWNHAAEIMAKEAEFSRAGGKWILYVPNVHVR